MCGLFSLPSVPRRNAVGRCSLPWETILLLRPLTGRQYGTFPKQDLFIKCASVLIFPQGTGDSWRWTAWSREDPSDYRVRADGWSCWLLCSRGHGNHYSHRQGNWIWRRCVYSRVPTPQPAFQSFILPQSGNKVLSLCTAFSDEKLNNRGRDLERG